MRTLNLTDNNTFYAPAYDDCWVLLAKEIMNSYSSSYANQICTSAFSQLDYDKIDQKKYAPQRRSILRRVKHGPLRNIIDIDTIYYAFEQERKANLKRWGIRWVDQYDENLNNL